MEIEQQPQRDVQQFHVTLQQSWPHDPVHFDGGANDLTGQSVSFGEIRVHGVGLILEQKETKETKNASHRILRHMYRYQFVKGIFSPNLRPASISLRSPERIRNVYTFGHIALTTLGEEEAVGQRSLGREADELTFFIALELNLTEIDVVSRTLEPGSLAREGCDDRNVYDDPDVAHRGPVTMGTQR